MKTILTALMLIVSLTSFCQWQPTYGPSGNITIAEIVSKDSIILVSSTCRPFISTNNGAYWTFLNNNTFNTSEIFKDTIYIASSSVRKFFNNGITWTESTPSLNNGYTVYDLYADTNKIYAATERFGFYYSTNGTNWQNYNAGLPLDTNYMPFPPYTYYTYKSYAVDGNGNFIFVGTKNGIYKSSKSSLTWSNTNNGIPNSSVNAILCKDSIVIIASNNKIYKSTNNGNSWLLTYTFSPGITINKIKNINDTIFVLTKYSGIYISLDFGSTFSDFNNGLSNLTMGGITSKNNNIFLGSGGGVFKYSTNWVKSSNHIVCADIIDLVKTDSCIATVDFADVSISKNNGLTWENSTSSLSIGLFWTIVNLNNSLFFSSRPTGMGPPFCFNYLSNDCGNSWSNISSLTNYGDPYILRSNGNKIIAVTDDIVFLSIDNGINWLNISPPSGMVCNNFNDALFVGNDIYIAACGQGQVIKTSDFGLNWVLTNNGLPTAEVYFLRECQGILFAASSFLYKSTDNGNSWQYCSNGFPGSIEDIACNNQYIFSCTCNRVFASNDNGNNWTDISTGLPTLSSVWGGSLIVKDSLLFFGTNNFGVWKRNLDEIILNVNETNNEPFISIYPNPTTNNIYIDIPKSETLEKIDILDLSGKIVYSLNNKGNKISINHLKQGLYLVKITTTNNQPTYSKIIKIN